MATRDASDWLSRGPFRESREDRDRRHALIDYLRGHIQIIVDNFWADESKRAKTLPDDASQILTNNEIPHPHIVGFEPGDNPIDIIDQQIKVYVKLHEQASRDHGATQARLVHWQCMTGGGGPPFSRLNAVATQKVEDYQERARIYRNRWASYLAMVRMFEVWVSLS